MPELPAEGYPDKRKNVGWGPRITSGELLLFVSSALSRGEFPVWLSQLEVLPRIISAKAQSNRFQFLNTGLCFDSGPPGWSLIVEGPWPGVEGCFMRRHY